MACSRRHRWGALIAAAALAAALLAPASAFADVDAMRLETEPVNVTEVSASAFGMESRSAVSDGAAQLSIARFCPMAVSASCDPATIEVGIDCGMEWMCGIWPCLCGSADAWGGCSCNGLETIAPDMSFSSSDEGVVRVQQVGDTVLLVPAGEGTATITCEASLRYHDTTRTAVEVTVGAPSAADAVLGGIAVVAIVAVVGIVFAIRSAVVRRRRIKAGQSHE